MFDACASAVSERPQTKKLEFKGFIKRWKTKDDPRAWEQSALLEAGALEIVDKVEAIAGEYKDFIDWEMTREEVQRHALHPKVAFWLKEPSTAAGLRISRGLQSVVATWKINERSVFLRPEIQEEGSRERNQ